MMSPLPEISCGRCCHTERSDTGGTEDAMYVPLPGHEAHPEVHSLTFSRKHEQMNMHCSNSYFLNCEIYRYEQHGLVSVR